MHQAKMEGAGWSVADTARHVTSSHLRSPGDGGQSPSSNGRVHNNDNNFTESVPVKRGQHYYELQRSTFEQKSPTKQQQQQPQKTSNFRSNSQEELDKLLAGLDKLTENLPDLNTVRSYSSLSGSEKPFRDAQPLNGSAKHFSNDIYSKPVQQQQQQQQHLRDSGTPDRQLSLIRPSVVAKQSAGLHSRENYEAGNSDSSVAMSALTAAQPYHTRTDSKPFSYIRTSAQNSRGPSRNLSRASSREGLGQPGLESPGLLRKIMGGGPATESDSGSRPLSPAITSKR